MKKRWVILLISMLVMCSCAVKTVTDDYKVDILDKFTKGQVERAILRAGNDLNWNMKKKYDGMIIANHYSKEGKGFTLEILYESNMYVFKYADSKDMLYNSIDRTISVNYLALVKELDKQIQLELYK